MGDVLTGVAAGVVAFVLGASGYGAILFGLSVFFQARQAERARKLRDQLGSAKRAAQTIRASVEPAKWRIGTTRCFGMLCQVAWQNRKIQYTLVIGEAPIAGVSRIWIQGRGIDISGTSVTLSADQALGDGGSGTAAKIDLYLDGSQRDGSTFATDPFNSSNNAEGLLWTSDMQMRGLAFAVIECTQDKDGSWWRGIPEVEFLTTGYQYEGETIRNAAEVRRWWEIEREGEDEDRIDPTSYASAVAVCTAAGYNIDGTIEADDPHEAIRDALDLAWDGTVVDWGGTLRFLPGTARAQSLIIPPADILELPTIQPSRDLHERINHVDMRLFQSSTADWQEHSMPPVIDMDAQARDGGVLVRDYGQVEYITDPAVATRTGGRQMIEVAGTRVSIRVPYGTESAPFRYLELMPGSIVAIDLPGLTGKRWRVDATGPAEDETLNISLSEEAATRYTASGLTVSAVPRATLVDPTDIPVPTGLVITFRSQVRTGQVVEEVEYTPGEFTPGSGGSDDEFTPGSGSSTMGTLTIESDRRIDIVWTEDDEATSWTVRVTQAGSVVLDTRVLPDEATYVYAPYVPAAVYKVEVAQGRGRRRSAFASATGTAPADRTVIPGS